MACGTARFQPETTQMKCKQVGPVCQEEAHPNLNLQLQPTDIDADEENGDIEPQSQLISGPP